jgi:hypothetical protein
MKIKNIFAINAGLVLLLVSACSALKSAPAQPTLLTPTPVVIPVTGIEYQFVTNKLLLPTTHEQTQTFGLNIDNDMQKTPDNKFGDLLTLLTSVAPDLELQLTLDQAIDTGQLVTLHMVKADDFLNDPNASWFIYLGQSSESAPTFNGSDVFTPDSATPANSPIIGSLVNGNFAGGPTTIPFKMFLLGQVVEVELIGVRLDADITVDGCANGKLGGGITVEQFRGRLLPALSEGLNQIVASESTAATPLLQAFDADKDKIITTQELEKNIILMIAISPDLDLLDSTDTFNPGQDGVKDSYSIGLGFTCVPADFITPEN